MPVKVQEISAPLKVQFELTYRCNHNCLFCYNVWKGDGQPSPEDEMPLVDVYRVIDNLASSGVFDLHFTGGEPLIRRDFFDIVEYAQKRDLGISVATNGTLVTDAMAARLKEHFPSVQISLHGGTPQTHDYLTGTPGSWRRATEAIERMKRVGLGVAVMMTVNRLNRGEVMTTAKLAHELGVDRFGVTRFVPLGLGRTNCQELDLTVDDVEQLLRELVTIEQELHLQPKVAMAIPRCSVEVPPEMQSRIVGCDGGITWCVISPSGQVRHCTNLDIVSGNVLTESLAEIWQKAQPMRDYRTLRHLPQECLDCKYVPRCMGGCRAAACSVHGRLDAPDPLCVPEKMALCRGPITTESLFIPKK